MSIEIFTKPHYRYIAAEDVKIGDCIYSKLCDGAYEVESIREMPGERYISCGFLEIRAMRGKKVWVRTKTKGIKR